MGARKRLKSEELKEEKKTLGLAVLRDCPTSPRKMRTLADLIRGMEVLKAIHILKNHPKHSSISLEKCLNSAINNWMTKNGNQNYDNLVVKTIMVDSARVLKRIRTAPQGRANRIRKRSNHVTIIVDNATN